MILDYIQPIIGLLGSLLSGLAVHLISNKKHKKIIYLANEQKNKDKAEIELKDLQIKFYKLEKDLVEWRDKYYATIQDLILVKAQLEKAILQLEYTKYNFLIADNQINAQE